MFNFTPEERKAGLFLLGLMLCGIVLSNLIKVNGRVRAVVYPQAQLAKLNLNQVDLRRLQQTRCLPAGLAQQLLSYRDAQHGFTSWEEVRQIKGVGDKRLDKLQGIFLIE